MLMPPATNHLEPHRTTGPALSSADRHLSMMPILAFTRTGTRRFTASALQYVANQGAMAVPAEKERTANKNSPLTEFTWCLKELSDPDQRLGLRLALPPTPSQGRASNTTCTYPGSNEPEPDQLRYE